MLFLNVMQSSEFFLTYIYMYAENQSLKWEIALKKAYFANLGLQINQWICMPALREKGKAADEGDRLLPCMMNRDDAD